MNPAITDMMTKVSEFNEAFEIATYEWRLRRDLLNEEIEEYAEAREQGDTVGMWDALGDICYIACGTLTLAYFEPNIYRLGPERLTLEQAKTVLYEIETRVDCLSLLAEVFDEIHRSNMTKVGGEKRADGKILKPEGYEPPNLEPILREAGVL